MKTRTSLTFFSRSCLAFGVAFSLWLPLLAQSPEPGDMKMKMAGKTAAGCQEMKEKQEKMMADTKVQDAELTGQVARMNSAPDNEKLGLMAALVTNMAEQRFTMEARKAKMEGEMRQHMMLHMQMGADSMSQCPMMKGMAVMDAKSDDAQKEHRADQK